jgi:hypothetical protein
MKLSLIAVAFSFTLGCGGIVDPPAEDLIPRVVVTDGGADRDPGPAPECVLVGGGAAVECCSAPNGWGCYAGPGGPELTCCDPAALAAGVCAPADPAAGCR